MFTQDSQSTNSATLPSYITFITAQWYKDETMRWIHAMLSSKWSCPFSDVLNNREEVFVCWCYKPTVKRSSAKMHLHLGNAIPHTRSVNIGICFQTGEKSSCQTFLNKMRRWWQLALWAVGYFLPCYIHIFPFEIFLFPLIWSLTSGKRDYCFLGGGFFNRRWNITTKYSSRPITLRER